MALLTQKRARRHEQGLLTRTMRFVAVKAILAHRGMLPDEGTALLSVACVTHVVCRVRIEQRARQGAVRVVAAHARHLSLWQRHMGTLAELGALLLMTGITGFGNARCL
ncbi:MAG: hypothetical protein A3G25_06580 [Betaproteobacteria bacterium RIFCSPLOWO2_12_FULL_63_13]|nr:MAG: hypothetical protein A3H32_01170 [Betaproteobacteria bacterium RIFCSPLOWO2_02_FULL_63_19]OGA44485.1 MAG: hypothetical protein A3G25_06580 [Betaproteobacteria bacterium RIFCSPLOWO2_12_FULL_63_13]